MITTSSSGPLHDTSSVPLATDSDPYFAEFVASSWITRARVVLELSPARRRRRLRHFVDGRDDDTGRSLMDHVAGSSNAVKLALEDVAVQPG
jgi:hypothetical protein